jgi:hypothetical protein
MEWERWETADADTKMYVRDGGLTLTLTLLDLESRDDFHGHLSRARAARAS